MSHEKTQRRVNAEVPRAETSFRNAMNDSLVAGLHAIYMEARISCANPASRRMAAVNDTTEPRRAEQTTHGRLVSQPAT